MSIGGNGADSHNNAATRVRERAVSAVKISGEYSERLGALARFTVRHKTLVIGAWVGLAVILALLFPQLETVVRQQSVDLIPHDAPSLQTVDRMSAAFGEQGSKTMVFVAMEDPAGLTPAARQHYEKLVSRLRADTTHVLLVQDLLADPVTEAQAVSKDRKAWYLPVGVAGTLGDPAAAESVSAVRAIAAKEFADSTTTVYVTGPPSTFSDQIASMEHALLFISIATAALIALILMIVYRSLFTALLPLLVIGLSLAVGRGVLSALGEAGMPVSEFTIGFMGAILLGAGTDYTVFLISRYHEQRRAGVPADQAAIYATASIGRVILASAATVALAFLSMVFAKLNVFAALGPACALAVFIGFLATVTLLPPLLTLAARRGIGDPKPDRTRRYWNSVAVAVVRRPAPLLTISLIILIALSGVATTIKISYDDRRGQPATTDSNQGYQLLDRHFRKDVVIGEFVVVENPADMRTGKGLADLDEMASRIAQIPGVTKVSGVTRPAGARLDQAQLSWQNGQIGDKMAGAVADGNARKDDLTKLTNGADQLAGGLAKLDTTLRSALTPLAGILNQAQTAGARVDQLRPCCNNFRPPLPTSTRPSNPGREFALWPSKPRTPSLPSTHSSARSTARRGVPPRRSAPKSVIRCKSWSPCATMASSTKSPTSATATTLRPTPPSPALSPTSKQRSTHWTRRSARWATPPTWPAMSAACRTASANWPPAHKHSPPGCACWPTATSKCCPA